MRAPSAARRRVTSLSRRSEPDTGYPRLSSTSAIPDMPIPPIPTKWMATLRRLNIGRLANLTRPDRAQAFFGVKNGATTSRVSLLVTTGTISNVTPDPAIDVDEAIREHPPLVAQALVRGQHVVVAKAF